MHRIRGREPAGPGRVGRAKGGRASKGGDATWSTRLLLGPVFAGMSAKRGPDDTRGRHGILVVPFA